MGTLAGAKTHSIARYIYDHHIVGASGLDRRFATSAFK